jgi:transcriptional regulator with XRE-family HTH domain
MKNIGDILKELRNEKGLTQDELANELNMKYTLNLNKGMISKWEGNKSEPTFKYTKYFSDFYNVSIDYLLGISEYKNIEEELNHNKDGMKKFAEKWNKDFNQKKNVEKDFPTIPERFTNADMARAYVMKHQIFAASGFYPERMSDEDILNFANEMINQAELISYKYKNK